MHGLTNETKISSICIRMPNWLGDAVMATPTLHLIRKAYPEASITLLTNATTAQLVEHNPYFDQLITFQKNESRQSIIKNLQLKRFDLGILLTNSLSSAWLFYKAKIPIRLGYAMHWRSPLLTHAIIPNKEDAADHLVVTYKKLLQHIGIVADTSGPQLFLSEEEITQSKLRLQECGISPDRHILIGINPGAAYGSAKCWPAASFKILTKMLLQFPEVRIVYFGDKSGKPLVDEICRGHSTKVVNLSGETSLRELMTLISQCHLFITNDSGPMHIAAALKVPLLAIFGSTSSIKTGPYGTSGVIRKNVVCSPCYLRSCPIDFRCMLSITPDEVFHEVQNTLHRHHITLSHSCTGTHFYDQ